MHMSHDWPSILCRDEDDPAFASCSFCGIAATHHDVSLLGWTEAELEIQEFDYWEEGYASWYASACPGCTRQLEDSVATLAERGFGRPDSQDERDRVLAVVVRALEKDPLLARRLRPRKRPNGIAVMVIDDRVRERLRYHLRGHDLDWKWVAAVPLLHGSGRQVVEAFQFDRDEEDADR